MRTKSPVTNPAALLPCFFILLLSFCLSASAQNYAVIKSFSPEVLDPTINAYTNSDGAYPTADLVVSGQSLYGVASGGGTWGSGTIFKINVDGTGFEVLYYFSAVVSNNIGTYTNGDGADPDANLVLSGGTLYGSTEFGGKFGAGTVFSIDTDGANFSALRHFSNEDTNGANPIGVIVIDGRTIFGTAAAGGAIGDGLIFRMDTSGSNFTVLHQMDATGTNGADPLAGLVFTNGVLYGTTTEGGGFGHGTVFELNTNNLGFFLLKSFTAPVNDTNSDGALPEAPLFLSGGVLYGTTYAGGLSSNGVVFRIATNGANFTNLYSFSGTTNYFGLYTNSDGAHPVSRLALAGNTLYGTSQSGGHGGGTVFSINTGGGSFTPLRLFGGVLDPGGSTPVAGLDLSGATFFGTTENGGDNYTGTIFRYQPQPTPLVSISKSGTNVVLTWPTNDFTYTLQTTPALNASSLWSGALPAPEIVNGSNTVINPAIDAAQFYRLSPF